MAGVGKQQSRRAMSPPMLPGTQQCWPQAPALSYLTT